MHIPQLQFTRLFVPILILSTVTDVARIAAEKEKEQESYPIDVDKFFHSQNSRYGNNLANRNLLNEEATCNRIDVCEGSDENDETSSSSPHTAPFTNVIEVQVLDSEDENENETDGFFANLFQRLMKALFRWIFRQKASNNDGLNSNKKYVIPTIGIVSDLSKYRSKFESLSSFILAESVIDSKLSTKPEIIQKLYNVSAENMMATSNALDTVVTNIKQQGDTIDIRSFSCNMMQFIAVLRDVTVPNIALMTEMLYTRTIHPNDDEMRNDYNRYKQSSNALETTTTENGVVPVETLYNSTSNNVQMCTSTSSSLNMRFFPVVEDLFTSNDSFGIVQHIGIMIGLVVFFPLSFIVSLLGIIASVFFLIFISLRRLFTGIVFFDDDTGWGSIFAVIILGEAIGAPILVILFMFRNLIWLFNDLLRPTLLSTQDTVATQQTSIEKVQVLSEVSSPRYATQINVISIHVSSLLHSPIDIMIKMVEQVPAANDLNESEIDESECELKTFICNRDSLFDVLPF